MSLGRPIKVLQIIARMNVGGPAVLVADLVRNLHTSKFETRLITGFCDENESDYLDEVATDILAIRVSGFGRSISVGKDVKSFLILLREIRRFKPDLIHTHTTKAGVLGRIAALIARPSAKRIHTFHGHLLHGYFNFKKVQAIVFFEKILGAITHKFISIGNIVKDDLIRAGVSQPNKFVVIYPGLQDLDLYLKSEARRILQLNHEKNYIVFIGRLTRIKRPDRLIELARSLKVSHPFAHLIIAGAGELHKTLIMQAEKESLPITFLGWRSDIGMILSASDIAVLCSDNEGIPLSLIQAAQAGLPVVSTNVGSVSDIVVDGVTGLLTEVSAKGIIQGISTLLSNPALGTTLGESARRRAKVLFSSQNMIEQHEKLYSQVILESF